MAIFKSMLLKSPEQHFEIYVLLFYYGLIIIIAAVSDLCGGSRSVAALIHFDCSAEECDGAAPVDSVKRVKALLIGSEMIFSFFFLLHMVFVSAFASTDV